MRYLIRSVPYLLVAALLSGQTIRVNVGLVQTDVMVFDADGRFVDDVTREQFELRVDGVPQPFEFFELIRTGSPEDERHWPLRAATPEAAKLPDRGQSLFFFVDDLHLSTGSVQRVRESLSYTIGHSLGPKDEAAVVLASGRAGFLQQLTLNRRVLQLAAARLNYMESGILDNERPLMQEQHALAIQQNNSEVTATFVEETIRENGLDRRQRGFAQQIVRTRAEALVARSANVTRNTLASLEELLKASAGLPGRKLVFLLSDGFVLQPQASQVLARLKAVTDAAAGSGTVIYSIDARGLVPDLPDSSVPSPADPLGRLRLSMGAAIATTESGMYNIAAETGGRFLHNTNALRQAIVETLAETSRYYLLGWHLDDSKAAARKRNSLSVTLRGRPALTVRLRQGSIDLGQFERLARDTPAKPGHRAGTVAEQLRESIRAPYPQTGLRTSLYAAFMHEDDTGWKLTIALQVGSAALSYTDLHGKRSAVVNILGHVMNDQGVSVSSFNERLTATQRSSAEPPPDIAYRRFVPLQPGLYQVRAAVLDESTGAVGSAYQWIEIPAFSPGHLSMSSIFLSDTSRSDTDAFSLSASRAYPEGATFPFVVQIYNAACRKEGSAPEVSVSMRLVRGNQTVLETAPHSIDTAGTDPKRLSYGARMSLDGLDPGSYIFEITAYDQIGKTSTSQQVELSIRKVGTDLGKSFMWNNYEEIQPQKRPYFAFSGPFLRFKHRSGFSVSARSSLFQDFGPQNTK